ncbi:MAG: alpha/beta hydrolase [Verrucomicrobia bacterium]|jgi:pimeloyl-ACP methyl ester carboxylesterase|nr:alpha/beta hydrolase [Verrucomicrobiota bacterium]
MRPIAVAVFIAVVALLAQPTANGATNEAVMLLHGLARSSRSMSKMERSLRKEGYTVVSLSYPSTKKTVEQLSLEHLKPAIAKCQASRPDRIHFVGHSLGNIVLRHYLSEHTIDNIGRIVMLGPPNKGSEVVDTLGHLTLYQWINGPAGNQLGTETSSLPNTLPVPAADIGVIAGTRSVNWILSLYIPGTDDGKVSPERAKIEGMSDFAEVPATHTFMMRNRKTIAMTLHFLRHGRFTPESP